MSVTLTLRPVRSKTRAGPEWKAAKSPGPIKRIVLRQGPIRPAMNRQRKNAPALTGTSGDNGAALLCMRPVGLEMIKQAKPDEKQPFVSHLQELRQRIVVCLATVGIAFLVTYYFRERVNVFLLLPFTKVMPAGSSFIFTGVTEAFITYFKIWIITAAALSSPVIMYQVWMFVSPGLYEKEKRYVYPLIIWGSLFFAGGVLFCYHVVMPNLYRFFVGFGSDLIVPMPDLKEYVSLTLKLLVVFGCIFEVPLVAYFFARAGIVRHQFLATKRRYAILAAFIISAVITPPDIISQMLLALPLWGLYELSLIIARFFGKKEPIDEGA